MGSQGLSPWTSFSPFRDLQIRPFRERDLTPLRRISKTCRDLVSLNKGKGRHRTDSIVSDPKITVAPSEDEVHKLPNQFDSAFSVPFSRFTELPPEIFRCIADHLECESWLSLRITCRRMLSFIQLAPDQAAKHDRLMFLTLLSKEAKYAQPGWIICRQCARLRPKDAFSASIITSMGSERVGKCLKHSKIWACPNRSYGAEELASLIGNQDFQLPNAGLINETNTMCCGSQFCEPWFSHRLYRDSGSPPSFTFESSILVTSIKHIGHEKDIRIRIATEFNKIRLQMIFHKMDVPICDHGLLNDHHMFTQLGRRNDEVEITDEREGGASRESKKGRHYYRGSCSKCEDAGTRTECRFNIVMAPASDGIGTRIELRVILTRDLGTMEGFGGNNTHWKNHALTSEKLSGFVRLWSA